MGLLMATLTTQKYVDSRVPATIQGDGASRRAASILGGYRASHPLFLQWLGFIVLLVSCAVFINAASAESVDSDSENSAEISAITPPAKAASGKPLEDTGHAGNASQKSPVAAEKSPVNCGPRIPNFKADCVVTHAGVVVRSVPNFTCQVDSDKDGVLDEDDQCPETPLGTRVDAQGCAVAIVFPDPILYRINSRFDSGRHKLLPDTIQTLDVLLEKLKITLHDESLEIIGHTDSIGGNKYNQKLSQRRAQSVADYLITNGIRRYSISVSGRGEDEPIEDNETDDGRAANRRIDVLIQGQEEGYVNGRYADGSDCPVPSNKGRYTLTSQFDSNKAVLKADAIDALDKIIDDLRSTPKDEKIEIVGHTDSFGSEESNRGLSYRRAQSAANYLIKRGIDSKLITVKGMGESVPVADNDTKAGRLKNRRIEILAN